MEKTLILAVLVTLGAASAASAAELDAGSAAAAIQAEARRNLPDTVVEVEVLDVSLHGSLAVPDGASVRVRASGDQDWIGRVSVELLAGGASVRATADVAAWVEVPVLRRPVAHGVRIVALDLAVGRRDASALPGGLLMDASDLVGRVPRRDLGLGQVVREADLESAPDGQRDRPVTLVLGRGALRITAAGVLREDGDVGDWVEVAQGRSGVVVQGILVSPDVVEVPAQATASRAQQEAQR